MVTVSWDLKFLRTFLLLGLIPLRMVYSLPQKHRNERTNSCSSHTHLNGSSKHTYTLIVVVNVFTSFVNNDAERQWED